MVPSLNEFNLDIDEEPTEPEVQQEPVIFTAEMINAMAEEETSVLPPVPQYVDENGKPIEYTEEELEMIEEEARAERNRFFKNKKNGMVSKIELPPR
jgi:hypothetical protein